MNLTKGENMRDITITINEKELIDLIIALGNYNIHKLRTKDMSRESNRAIHSVNSILKPSKVLNENLCLAVEICSYSGWPFTKT